MYEAQSWLFFAAQVHGTKGLRDAGQAAQRQKGAGVPPQAGLAIGHCSDAQVGLGNLRTDLGGSKDHASIFPIPLESVAPQHLDEVPHGLLGWAVPYRLRWMLVPWAAAWLRKPP